LCFFPRILKSLPPLPRQHSAAIGCAKTNQPIGVTVHSHCVESFEGLLQRCRRGKGCSELWKNTLYVKLYINIRLIDEEQLLQLVTYRQDMHHSLKKCRHPGNWLPSLRDQKLRKQGGKNYVKLSKPTQNQSVFFLSSS